MAFQAGDRIGGYEIVGVLGAGGMGKVYRVRNMISERLEAMKILLPNLTAEPELADRFMREIRVQARLQHPNIASLNTAFQHENQLVMVMELVEGVSLQERLSQGALTIDQTIDYTCQILRALSYAHSQGVVHRDIKPANMMLTPHGVVKLLDFGIAKAAEDRKLTKTGMAVGSIYYMAPEQIQGLIPDSRSDLYSLGIALYQFATGKRPVEGDSEFAIMTAHLQGHPVPPVEVDPRIPAALNDIILMALQKKPEERFQTADAFLHALESVRTASPLSAPPVIPQATRAVPQAAAAPSVAPVAPVAPAKPAGSRALYMAAGAIAAVLVLGLAAVQLPRLLGTHAAGPAPVKQESAAPAGQVVDVKPSPAEPPAPVTSTPVTSTPGMIVTPVQHPEAPQTTLPPSTPVPARPLPDATQTPVQQKPAQQVPVQQPTAPPVQPPAQQQAPPPAQPNHPVNSEEAAQMRESLTMLGARIAAVNRSLDNLQRQQAASGLSLRTDMAGSQELMMAMFSGAQQALTSGDVSSASRQMQRAEQNLEKLEKFLGR